MREQPRHWYHFLTTICAVLGGVFTCAGILDSILHSALGRVLKGRAGKLV